MARTYTNTNKIKFTNIAVDYKITSASRSMINQNHAKIVTYVISHYKNTKKYKQQIVDALNLVTYYFFSGDLFPETWKISKNPIETAPEIDSELIEETLGDWYLTVESILWDVKPTNNMSSYDSTSITTETDIADQSTGTDEKSIKNDKSDRNGDDTSYANLSTPRNLHDVDVITKAAHLEKSALRSSAVNSGAIINPTPKQDLYIQSPTVPLIDYNKPWMKGVEGADSLIIYTTLPEIPRKQNEISVTTDVTKMTIKELMRLYPNRVIHTRACMMYEPVEGVELIPDLGLIIPIEGFTRDQIIDNIIRYPHIFQLKREVDGKLHSFYSHIEIDGELKGTLDVWDSLPESKVLPRHAEFVKEYVVRRYLLERDIKHANHVWPIFGNLDEFLTLFMPSENYISYGYSDVEQIVKQCVISRVSYKQSRNPVIRRLTTHA